MLPRLNYGRGLAATVLGGIAATVLMLVPAWLWSEYVLDVALDAVVGRSGGLDTWDRILLYSADLVLVAAGYLVYAGLTRRLYRMLQGIDVDYWDTFQALVATGILAALVAYFFPFLGLVVAIFAAPALVNGMAETDEVVLAPPGEQPMADPRSPRRAPV
jgi:hypothetical protein